ncbi:MAG TPA: alpha/beta hydrolase, partial [Candidatus Thermoplasmatota archaeon]|nr:alpha/beta hydrolase [Candidatus Thermoplasmatota archaeon]
GAAAAINAAPEIPEVDAIVADSAFATLTNIASNSITRFTGLPKYPYGPLSVLFAGWMVGRDVGDNRPVDAIGTLRVPVLVIQGDADDIAYPDDDGRALAAAAPPGSRLWLAPGAHHVGASRTLPEEYEARVLGFLASLGDS